MLVTCEEIPGFLVASAYLGAAFQCTEGVMFRLIGVAS